jgi:AGZA family xanthine/uracil permease-like MFS transporter
MSSNPQLKPTEVEVAKLSWLDRQFKLSERKTNVKTELLAGVTTFITMSYIILVVPGILSEAGMPKEAAIAAVIFSSVIATLLYALLANMPIAVAPGLGLVSFFAYTVVLGMGLTWQTGLGAVFISGVTFLVLTITGVRKKIIDAVPEVLRSAIGVGIGLFITFIGLKNAGLVVASKGTAVALGKIMTPGPLLAIAGLVIAAVLTARKVKGALIVSILVTTIVAMIIGVVQAPKGIGNVVSLSVPSLSETFMQMDIKAAIGYGILSVIFSFTIVELFDNSATLISLTRKAGIMDENGKIENMNQAFVADAIATMSSASLGATAMNAYLENATGIAEGGKTGLTALVVGGLFLIALLFTPLVAIIPPFATAPALILVGAFMFTEIRHINLDDFTDVVPAFLTIIMMPLTFSIAEGLAFGFISYSLLKVLTGKAKEATWMVHFISIAFIINFFYHG